MFFVRCSKGQKVWHLFASACLFDRNGPTTRQKLFVEVIRKIQSACVPRPKSCLYGTDKEPTLYPKLIYSKYDDAFDTRFYQRKNIESNEDSTRGEPRKFLKKTLHNEGCYPSGRYIFDKDLTITRSQSRRERS